MRRKSSLIMMAAAFSFSGQVDGVNAESGQATWHVFDSEVACPGSFGTTKVFAFSSSRFDGAECGKCARVTGRKGSVVARFVDKCVGPSCKDIDLSDDAFNMIADMDEGITDITFSPLVPCEDLQEGFGGIIPDGRFDGYFGDDFDDDSDSDDDSHEDADDEWEDDYDDDGSSPSENAPEYASAVMADATDATILPAHTPVASTRKAKLGAGKADKRRNDDLTGATSSASTHMTATMAAMLPVMLVARFGGEVF